MKRDKVETPGLELFGISLLTSTSVPRGTLLLIPKVTEPRRLGESLEEWAKRALRGACAIRGLGDGDDLPLDP